MIKKWQAHRKKTAQKREQAESLSVLWRAHMRRDQKAEREWIITSIKHFNQKNKSVSALLEAAEATAAVLFSRWRIFLPIDGLNTLLEYLVNQGFYFEPYDKQLVKALFPAGWKLVHTEGKHIYLVDPSGKIVAKIFYKCSRFEYKATITPS